MRNTGRPISSPDPDAVRLHRGHLRILHSLSPPCSWLDCDWVSLASVAAAFIPLRNCFPLPSSPLLLLQRRFGDLTPSPNVERRRPTVSIISNIARHFPLLSPSPMLPTSARSPVRAKSTLEACMQRCSAAAHLPSFVLPINQDRLPPPSPSTFAPPRTHTTIDKHPGPRLHSAAH
ncbi:hypothetical protein LX36DRAFT_664482 [Colletotrichum falcatum]|nr:hypothetical protein LX36DRAFT_664482 [Colletotrichum falcatum]